MKTTWTAGMDKDDAEEFEQHFLNASLVREKLLKIIESKYSSSISSTLTKGNYANANWAYEQADSIGYMRALKEISNLL